MFDPSNIFHLLLIIPILNVLIAIYQVLTMLAIPGALGFSLIILTVIIRLVLTPLTLKQLKSTYKLGALKPELDKLTAKYKDNKQQLHQEQLKLYKKEGINPAAGCLPLLVQMPVIIALYNLFFRILSNGDMQSVVSQINNVVYAPWLKIAVFDLSFFGLNLAHKPSEWQKYGVFLILIPVITAALQYYQAKTMTPKTQSIVKKDQNKGKEEDMGAMMQKQMVFMMPLMIGFFAYSFPIGLSLYWNTFTIFGIIQQRQINKLYKHEKSKNSKNN